MHFINSIKKKKKNNHPQRVKRQISAIITHAGDHLLSRLKERARARIAEDKY